MRTKIMWLSGMILTLMVSSGHASNSGITIIEKLIVSQRIKM